LHIYEIRRTWPDARRSRAVQAAVTVAGRGNARSFACLLFSLKLSCAALFVLIQEDGVPCIVANRGHTLKKRK
ncbi:MAG: hypothetical protein LUG25_06585, partial [Oscillospiraceae bacterium]|nr:hypothetical protein [Oscillospiraceae bacterium]